MLSAANNNNNNNNNTNMNNNNMNIKKESNGCTHNCIICRRS